MAQLTNPMGMFNGMTPEEIDIARKQKLADMLTKQAEQPLEGQMVSGRYVAPSWTQMLAKGLNAYMAGKTSRDATDMQKQYGKKQRTDFMDTAQKYAAALKGIPADTMYDPELGQDIQALPAQPGSRDAAMNVAMKSNSPMWQQLAMQQAMQVPAGPKWTLGERFNEKTGMPEKIMYDANNPTNVMPFGGQQAPKLEAVNGQMVNPYNAQPQGAAIPKQANPATDLLIPDGQGGFRLNDQLVEAKKAIAKSGAPTTQAITNVNAYEPFKNKIQGEMGTALVKNYETLQNIPQTLQALDTAKSLAAKAGNFIGSGGEDKLAIAKFFNNNLGTNIDPNGVANAEALRSALFYNVMDNLKKMDASPSEKQQEVMQNAFGKIGTDPKALPMIIDFYRKQIISKAKEHNRRVDETTKPRNGYPGLQFPYDIHIRVPQDNEESATHPNYPGFSVIKGQ